MKVQINESPVDIQLQDEKHIIEVVHQLDAWLREQGHTVSGVRINGNEADLSNDNWHEITVESTDLLELETSNMHALRQANLEVLHEFAVAFHHALTELSMGTNTITTIRELIETYPAVRPAMNYLNGGTAPGALIEDQFTNALDQAMESSTRPDGSFNADILTDLAGKLYGLVILTQDRLNEIANPIREAQTTGSILQNMIPDLGMVSTRILSGKGKEAYDTIMRFSELMSKLMRLFWLMVESQSPNSPPPFSRTELENWAKTINQSLVQVTEALDSQDTVMLGDILEYELPDQINQLITLIPTVEKE